MINNKELKIIGLTALGGALEFYDFTIYALFAPYLSQHFFPNNDPWLALMNTFAVFAIGYFARPCGGLIFGHLGDRFGRKYAFSLAIFLMATATLLIGCLPSYQSVGLSAPLSLIVLRLIQGFSVGGEIPGATIFVLEHVTPKHRGAAVGLIFMCITLGNTLGAGVGYLLTSNLNPEAMNIWGWRLPFIMGFILGIVSFIVRLKTVETPAFMAMVGEKKMERRPLFSLLRSSTPKVLQGFLLTAVSAATVSFFLYLPTYLSQSLQVQMAHAYQLNLVSFLIFALTTAFFGWLSDTRGCKKLMITGSSLLLLVIYPLFYSLSSDAVFFVWKFIIVLAILAGMLNGCYGVTIASLFPVRFRYSGMGLSYSLGFAIFGGLAPLCFTYLIKACADVKAPAYYFIGCTLLTLVATIRLSST